MVDGAQPNVEAGPVRGDPLADAGAERGEMIQQALDLGPQEGDNPDLVARVERAFDLGDAVVDPISELVQGRQGLRLARGLDHRLCEAKLGEKIGLDRLPPLRGRAADVREAVERVHPLEDDRLQLGQGGRGAPLPLEAVEHGPPESPLDGGVNRGALLVDDGLDAAVQLLHAPLDRHGEQGQHFLELGEVGRVQIPDAGRDQLQGADHLVLVVERSTDEVPDPALDQLLLDRGRIGVRLEIVDDDGAILDERPLVERPLELRRRVVGGVGEDTRLLVARRVVQDEHAVSLHRRETRGAGPAAGRTSGASPAAPGSASSTRSSPCR